jgi:hypothetical protein
LTISQRKGYMEYLAYQIVPDDESISVLCSIESSKKIEKREIPESFLTETSHASLFKTGMRIEMSNIKKEIDTLQKVYSESLERRLNGLADRLNQYDLKTSTDQTQVDLVLYEMEERDKENMRSKEKLDKTIRDLSKKLEAKEGFCLQLETDLKADIIRKEDQVTEKNKEIKRSEKEIQRLKDLIELNTNTSRSKDETIYGLNITISELKATIERLEISDADKDRKLQILQNNLDYQVSKCGSNEQANIVLKSEVDTLLRSVADFESQIQSFEDEKDRQEELIQEKNYELSEVKSQLQLRERQIERIEEQGLSSQESIEVLIANSEKKKVRLIEELRNLKAYANRLQLSVLNGKSLVKDDGIKLEGEEANSRLSLIMNQVDQAITSLEITDAYKKDRVEYAEELTGSVHTYNIVYGTLQDSINQLEEVNITSGMYNAMNLGSIIASSLYKIVSVDEDTNGDTFKFKDIK